MTATVHHLPVQHHPETPALPEFPAGTDPHMAAAAIICAADPRIRSRHITAATEAGQRIRDAVEQLEARRHVPAVCRLAGTVVPVRSAALAAGRETGS